VRQLITQIKVTPAPKGEPVGLEVAGDLAALLTVNAGGTPVVRTLVAGGRSPFCYNSKRYVEKHWRSCGFVGGSRVEAA
jgi:hypothetical protein